MDIRSYFLVTMDDKSIKFWTHPVSSIKFASSEFTLDDLTESIHITNAYVQQKYHATPKDNPIPYHRMWSNDDFIAYLKSKGMEYVWHEKVYPSMKKYLIEIAKSVCINIEKKPGRFELFGCDWIITEDYNVYLLEIQRPPGMGYYSQVSIIVCGKILEDTIRVTVDYQNDSKASTGGFEIIYEEEIQLQKKILKEKHQPTLFENDQENEQTFQEVNLPQQLEDKLEDKEKSLDDEILSFESAIETYNDKIIEVECKS